MNHQTIGRALAFGLFTGLTCGATAQPIDLASIAPKCTGPFDYKDGKCVAEKAKLDKLNTPQLCVGPGLEFKDGACAAAAGKAPEPICGDALPDLAFRAGRCFVDRKVPRSASADYVGDCFKITAVLRDDNSIGYPTGTYLKVLSQKAISETDRELMVAESKGSSISNCEAKPGSVATTVKASDLVEIGAERIGWAYGVLAMPYKYYAEDRSFAAGVSIGPYFGRRWGMPGSAYTFAVAATIGTVKGEVRDASNNVTSTPDLQAFSLAVGFMWDVAKAAGTKPFKLGVFSGADWVSSDNVVKFKHNRKPWIALQIGFDFTDN